MNEARAVYPRLEEQIDWYDHKSAHHQRWYRRFKVISIAAAALVPLVSGLEGYALIAGTLGVVVVVAEGLQHINQHHENWIRYRSTCESLRHEKYLYLAGAPPYEGMPDDEAFRQLASNVESLLAREGDEWLLGRRNLDKRAAEPAQAGE